METEEMSEMLAFNSVIAQEDFRTFIHNEKLKS
jgi:hypothetical protein